MTTTVRISAETRAALRELASQTGEPMLEILQRAVEAYRRRRMLELANERYAALRADPAAWEDEQAERRQWEHTLADGLATP